ncbi:MAG: glycosyltransferase [Hyphomicrobiaceae bacterium]
MTSGMVVFGEDWGRHPSSTQHLVRRLAAANPVLWVNSIGMRRPQLSLRDLKRAANKILGSRTPRTAQLARTATQLPDGLSLMSPLAVSWPGNSIAYAANRILLTRQIKQRLTERGITRPILWTSLPTALPAVGHLGERAVVYYCGDDFGSLAGVDHAPVLEMEAELVKKADLVLAASDVLARRFPKEKTLLVPHGADIALFAEPAPRAADLPADRPVAGFYGSLAAWVDIDLLVDCATKLPGWQFVFVGSIETDVTPLTMLPNVTFLGPRQHHELPGYAQHWQVSMLPFRDCPQIQACNPLKLREYMAAGPEIVTTDFPALNPYRDLISVAHGRAAFAGAIAASLSAPDKTLQRRARVKTETWEARAADVATALAAL